MTVLFVEDSETLRTVMAGMIPRKHTVLHAETVAEARKSLVNGSRVDAIVLDLHLSDSPSWEQTAKLIPAFRKHAPVLVCTGAVDPEIRKGCLRLGADGFITKYELALDGRLLTALSDAMRRYEASGSQD